MPNAKQVLQNLVHVDEARIDEILEQLPNSHSIFENLKAKFGITIKVAKFEIEATSPKISSTLKKIKRLEKYLDRNGLLNKSRPRRTPHAIVNGSQYWWVKETFVARKVIIPTPYCLKNLVWSHLRYGSLIQNVHRSQRTNGIGLEAFCFCQPFTTKMVRPLRACQGVQP